MLLLLPLLLLAPLLSLSACGDLENCYRVAALAVAAVAVADVGIAVVVSLNNNLLMIQEIKMKYNVNEKITS